MALETLAMLLAERGDVFLIPAPYYSSFVDNINERAGVVARTLRLQSATVEEAYRRR